MDSTTLTLSLLLAAALLRTALIAFWFLAPLLTALLSALLTAGGLITLRISSRRLRAALLSSALLTLISFSIVCHCYSLPCLK